MTSIQLWQISGRDGVFCDWMTVHGRHKSFLLPQSLKIHFLNCYEREVVSRAKIKHKSEFFSPNWKNLAYIRSRISPTVTYQIPPAAKLILQNKWLGIHFVQSNQYSFFKKELNQLMIFFLKILNWSLKLDPEMTFTEKVWLYKGYS